MKFMIILPEITDIMLSNNNETDVKCPISSIAKQLYHKNDINDVIIAFRSLYNKYIDSNNASFMINISSNTRESLMILLDCSYYQRTQLKRKRSNRRGTIFGSIGSNRNVLSLDADSITLSETDNYKSLIDVEFAKQNQSNKWLLTTLITQMDVAAWEIANLMSDSFSRYNRDNIA